MLKYIGAALILLIALYLSREHRKEVEKRLGEGEACLLFMKSLRREVGCFLRPISEWAREYDCACGGLSSLLSHLRSGTSLCDAYREAEGELCLSTSVKRSFSSFCASFGKGYMEDELRMADAHIAQLEQCLEGERAEGVRQCRLVSTLSVSCSFAIVILLI